MLKLIKYPVEINYTVNHTKEEELSVNQLKREYVQHKIDGLNKEKQEYLNEREILLAEMRKLRNELKKAR